MSFFFQQLPCGDGIRKAKGHSQVHDTEAKDVSRLTIPDSVDMESKIKSDGQPTRMTMLVRHLDQDLTAKEPTKSVLFTSKPLCAKLLILCLNGFVFCPLCVFFWTSAWDIVWNLDQTLLLGVPLTCLTCWAVSHGILLLFYLAQHPMQSWHNRRMAEGWKILTFMLRTIYFYLLSLAYILWYYAYWEAYVYYTTPQPGVSTTENEDSENSTTFNEINSTSTEVPAALKLEFDKYRWLIFVAIALALIFVYRYIIRGSLDIITNSIPFTVDLSLKNEVFFLQYTYVKTSKVTPE